MSDMELQVANVSCNVYTAGLPPDFTDQQLYDLFAPYGPISSARIMRAKGTRASKGYGFVLFEDPHSSNEAVCALNGVIIGGHRIQARPAHAGASSTLRKFAKRPSSTPSSSEQSTAVSPVFQSLPAPFAIPLLNGAPTASIIPSNYAFPASTQAGGTPMLTAALPAFCPPGGVSQMPQALSLSPAATNTPLNCAVPQFGQLGQQQVVMQQQPMYVLMVSQDGQPTLNYPC